jgi:hypothetical protein
MTVPIGDEQSLIEAADVSSHTMFEALNKIF